MMCVLVSKAHQKHQKFNWLFQENDITVRIQIPLLSIPAEIVYLPLLLEMEVEQ